MDRLKPLLSFAIIFCILFTTSCKQKNETEVLKSFTPDIVHDSFDMDIALKQNNVYITDKDRILIYGVHGDKIDEIADERFKDCKSLYAGDDCLYAYDGISNMVFSIDYGSKKVIGGYSCPDGIVVNKFVVIEEEMYFLDIDKHQVMSFNFNEKILKPCNVENVEAMCLLEENTLLMVQTTEDMIYKLLLKYELQSGQYEYMGKIDKEIKDVFYSSDDQTIILANLERTYEYSLDCLSSMILITKPVSEAYYKDVAVNGSIMATIDTNNVLELHDVRCLKNSITINALTVNPGFDESMHWIVNELNGKYGRVNIKVNVLGKDEYKDRLLLKFMARDDDFDIFEMDKCVDYQFILKGRYIDLSRYDAIDDAFGEMIPEIKGLCSYEGKIIGVPYHIYSYIWVLNTALKDKLGIDIPIDWDWDKFYELAKEIRDISRDRENTDAYILRSFAYNFLWYPILEEYNAQYVDLVKGKIPYNTKEVKYLIELCKRIYDEGLVSNEGSIFQPFEDNILFYQTVYDGYGSSENYVPPPYEANPVYVNLYCINRESDNIELCVDFLAAFMSSDARKRNNLRLLPYYKSFSTYEGCNDYGGITRKGYNLFVKILQKAKCRQDIFAISGSETSPGNSSENPAELFNKFLSNEITVDEFVGKISGLIDMLVNG